MGTLMLRQIGGVKFLRKWMECYFILNNERLVVYKMDAAATDTTFSTAAATAARAAAGTPVLDIRLHGNMKIAGFKPYPTKTGIIMSCKYQEMDQTLGSGGGGGGGGGGGSGTWKTLFKFGSKDSVEFELIKCAMNAVITFQRKKDPTLAVKRSFSFGS